MFAKAHPLEIPKPTRAFLFSSPLNFHTMPITYIIYYMSYVCYHSMYAIVFGPSRAIWRHCGCSQAREGHSSNRYPDGQLLNDPYTNPWMHDA